MFMYGLQEYLPWLVWLFPILSSFIVPVFTKMGSKSRDLFIIFSGAATLVFAILLIPTVYSGSPIVQSGIEWIPVVDIKIGVYLDPLSVLFTNLIAFIGFVVLLYSLSYMAHEEGLTRYYFFMLFFIGSMIGLVMADNFLQLFIFWELVGLCSYALVSFWYKKPEAVKAGIKVFLMTKIGDIALLASIFLIYANVHSLSYIQVFEESKTIAMPILTVTSLLFLFGATVKSAQLPLHTWLYNAMEAPTSVSCLLHGATMVKAGVYLIARTHVMFYEIPIWLSSLAWIGAITALIGATLALHTSDIKGVPAYSTVSQIGFMMAALGVASSPTSLGWFASIFHMISHAFFQGLGFLAIGGIIHQLGTRDMRKMGGLRRDMPITFALCIIVILARSGIPPFSSFFSKGLIAKSVLSTGDILLAFLIYSAAAVTFAYSYRFLVLTFAGEKPKHLERIEIHEPPRLMLISSAMLAAGCVILGFLGESITQFLHTNFVFNLADFLSFESLIFMATLIIGGLPIYLVYQQRVVPPERIRSGALAFLDKALENGYFFDSLYGAVSRGFIKMSNATLRALELGIMERIPYIIATSSVRLSRFILYRFDKTLDEFTHLTAHAVEFHSLKIKRTHGGALPQFVAAVVLGFLFLSILLLLTMR